MLGKSIEGLRGNVSARVRKRGQGSDSRGGGGDVAGDGTGCKSAAAESYLAWMIGKIITNLFRGLLGQH